MIRRPCIRRGPDCSDGGLALPGRSRCARHGGKSWSRVPPERQAVWSDPVYKRLRTEILASKPPCSYPGCPRIADTLDHIVPVSRGGTNVRENLRPMCHVHNQALGAAEGRATMKARAKRKP